MKKSAGEKPIRRGKPAYTVLPHPLTLPRGLSGEVLGGVAILASKLLKPVDIVVDSREAAKASDIVEEIKRKGVEVAVAELEAGDYYLLAKEPSKAVLVERKTVTDFANSIRDNRIWSQVKRLREAADVDGVRPVILLEGWLGVIEKRTKWNIVAVLRVLDTIAVEMGVPIIPVHNRKAAAAWLAAKARSLGATSEKRVARLRVEKKPPTINERILYVAEGLAGPVIARRLLEKFGTLRRIANASIQELMGVEGVGEKRAKEIYAIFNTEWSG